VNSLTAGDVQVILDVSNVAPGSFVLPLRVNLPKFVELATGDLLRASVVVTVPADETSGSGGDGGGSESEQPTNDDASTDTDDSAAETADASSPTDIADAGSVHGQSAIYSG
jgi:hypothetical protein